MNTALPLTRELVLIGGGHTHALVLKRWGMKPLPGARLTVVNPGPTAPYTGMLPGYVAGHYGRDDLEIDLVRLARFAGARLILGAVDAIDRAARQIHIVGRGMITYDIASIDIGITTDMPQLEGFADHGIGAKPLGAFAARWAAHLEAEETGDIAVIGGGVGGIELAMAMAYARAARCRPANVTVIDRSAVLEGVGARARPRLLRAAAALGVSWIEYAELARVTGAGAELADGRTVGAGLVVGVAGGRPYDWLGGTGLKLQDGYIVVDEMLRSSDPAIYAAGDCAHLAHAPRPKAGVFAVRAAPVLERNLKADLSGSARRPFRPQRDYLKLISLGRKAALGEKYGIPFQGGWVWRWKDRIDRAFMTRLGALRPMQAPALPSEVARGVRSEIAGGAPLCGGCGAKVGPEVLERTLQDLKAPSRSDVEHVPGDDAAILTLGNVRQVITTDHLRSFTLDPGLMARIAAIHALGDVWAMGAAPQAALAQVILPRMAPALQDGWMAEIMAAAGEVFAAAGAEIVGGHTSQGDELTLGFTVTGIAAGPPITLQGAMPGDALILTRPIGTGVILAGEMAIKARGTWVARALAEMAQSQAEVARILHGAHAMTDVTGFGLAGHLMNMCSASDVAAELQLDAIPFYDGAEALAARGIRSTLYEANRAVAGRMQVPQGPKAELVFDPQTAGGLLAAVPSEEVEGLSRRIGATGATAAVIGQIVPGPAFITVA